MPRAIARFTAMVGAICGLGLVCVACSGNLENLEDTPVVLECGRQGAPNEAGTQCQPMLAPNISSKDIEFPSSATPGGQTMLRGTLTMPDWGAAPNLGKKLPAIVLIGGAGPVSRAGLVGEDTNGVYKAPVAVLQDLAEGLSRRGYAVVRYDKRTCTPDINPMCTSPPEIAKATTWDDLVGDAVAASKFVASVAEVDKEDIIVIGHGQGVEIALAASSQVGGLSDVVLVSGVFDPIDSVMVRRIKWQLEAFKDSVSEEELEAIQKRLSVVESGFLAIKEGYMPDNELFQGETKAFWGAWIGATTMTEQIVQQLNKPILYLRGSDDQDASAEDQEGFAGALQSKPMSKAMELSGHNHAMVRKGEGGKVSDECIGMIADWLGRPPTGPKPTIERLD